MINSKRKGKTGEVWKDIENYEGLYQISNFGRVKSISFRNKMTNKKRDKILKLYVNKNNGYQYVCLSKNNKKYTVRVHKLVMETFFKINKKEKYDKLNTINHKNGNKIDNRLENLEWCSQSLNQIHAYKLGLQTNKTRRKVIRLNDKKIYSSVIECAMDNGTNKPSVITRVCKGNRSNYKGNKFAYYEDFVNNTIPKFKGKFEKNTVKIWEK